MSVGTHNKFLGTRNGTGTESKNRKKRNRSQEEMSPISRVVHHAVCGCTVGWLSDELASQGWCVRQQVEGGLAAVGRAGQKVRRRKPHAKAVKNSAPLPLPAGKSRAHSPPPRPPPSTRMP